MSTTMRPRKAFPARTISPTAWRARCSTTRSTAASSARSESGWSIGRGCARSGRTGKGIEPATGTQPRRCRRGFGLYPLAIGALLRLTIEPLLLITGKIQELGGIGLGDIPLYREIDVQRICFLAADTGSSAFHHIGII